MVHHWPGFFSCALIVRKFERGPYIFHFFVLPFRKQRQHFLSQNNLSLCLTRLPAIFTQLNLQMIYFQLHYSPALWHMVLSITVVTTEQDRQSSETLSQTERVTKKNRKKVHKRRQTEGFRHLIHISFAGWLLLLEGADQSEWNYWAFI